MARTTATNFSGGLQFPYATAATDVFKKEDVQTLAQAVDQHDHTAGKGHSINTVPANASITNAMLASDVARANLLTNGGFEIWQRGNGPFTAGAAFAADRWQLSLAGSDTLSVSRNTTTIDNGSASAACTFVLGTGAGGTAFFQTCAPGTDMANLKGRTLSLSMRVNTATANAVRAFVNCNGTGGSNLSSPFHTGGGTWQTLTVTNTIPVDATTLNVGVSFAASCTAYLDNAMLVVGSQYADYAPLHPADDLARCLRYYARIDNTNKLYHTPAMCTATNSAAGAASWPVQMAVVPTVTFTNIPGMSVVTSNGTGVPLTALTSTGASVNGVLLQPSTAGSLTTGNATYFTWTAGASIVAEANP